MPEITDGAGNEIQVTDDQQAELNLEAEAIARSGGTSDFFDDPVDGSSEENPNTDTEQALSEGNLEDEKTQAPDEEQPSDDQTKVQGEDKEKSEEEKKDESEEAVESEEDKAKREAEELKSNFAKMLNLKTQPKEPETLEDYKVKYQESSREAHKLAEEASAFTKLIESKGLKVVLTKDGEPKFANTPEFEANYETDEDTVKDIVNGLTDEEKAMVDEDANVNDVVSMIVKKYDLKSHAERPNATAKPEDVLIPDYEVDQILTSLSHEKDSEGNPRLPDLMEKDTLDLMQMMYIDPKFESLHQWANQNNDNFGITLELLYNSAARYLAPQKAIAADAEAQKKIKEETLKQDASVSTDGAAGKGEHVGETKTMSLAEEIARAGQPDRW